jgi:hypothetical protein
MLNKLFFSIGILSMGFMVSCSSDCSLPLRDAFNFYIVNGAGQDIFTLDPTLNKDSVYLAVEKNSMEQPATRSIFTRQAVGMDTFNTFYNANIPDLNINSDTQTVFLYTPHNRKDVLQVITYNQADKKCGSVLRIGKINKANVEVIKTEGYYKIIF